MRKVALIIASLTLIIMTLPAQEGIQFFQGSWAETLAKSKESQKLIFLDAYAEWCGPCKRMAADVFTQKEVGEYYNSTFIPVKIDMEKGEGVALARLYNVRAYPTLLFINWKGEVVHRAVGGRNVEGLIALGKEALDDTKNLRSVAQQYQQNPDDINHIIQYCNVLKQTYDRSYTTIITDFLATQPDEILLTHEGWKIISNFVDDPDSAPFQYLLTNRPQFEEKFGKQEVSAKIGEVIEVMIQSAVRKNDPDIMQVTRQRISAIPITNQEYYLALADLLYFQRRSDWPAYGKAALKLISYNPEIKNDELNRYAWNFYLNVEDPSDLATMTDMVAQAIMKSDEYAIHDTYAALLHKTGKHKQALKEAKAAIALAKKEGAPYEETLELITEIEKKITKK